MLLVTENNFYSPLMEKRLINYTLFSYKKIEEIRERLKIVHITN